LVATSYFGVVEAGIPLLLGAIVLHGWWRGTLRVAPGPALAVLILMAAYPLAPSNWFATGFLDIRVLPLILFTMIAATDPGPMPRWATLVIVTGFIARTLAIASVWAGHNPDVQAMRHAIARVPVGARVIAVTASNEAPMSGEPLSRHVLGSLDSTFHLPALLVMERGAYWPLLFTAPGKQPVHVLPPYADTAMDEGWLVSWRELTVATPRGLRDAPYLADWRDRFDFVLVTYANRLKNPVAPGLTLVAGGGFVACYRIDKPEGAYVSEHLLLH
jgi:hypothetical protein